MMECCFTCEHLVDFIPWWYDTDEYIEEIICDHHCMGFDYETNTCKDYVEENT